MKRTLLNVKEILFKLMHSLEISYGLIHCHTENSKKDSAMSVKKLVGRAKELNCPAIILTNHGNCIDFFQLKKECDNNGIKAIFGIEVYVKEDEKSINETISFDLTTLGRCHMVIIAKDIIGYKVMLKLIKESYGNIDIGRTEKYPCITHSMIKKYFGKGTDGYGHIFICSACIAGVPSMILLNNKQLEKKINKHKENISKYNDPNSPSYLANVSLLKEIEETLAELKEKKKSVSKIAKKPTLAKEKKMNSYKGKDEEKYKKAFKELEELKKEIEVANKELKELETDIKDLETRKKLIKGQLKEEEKTHIKWNAINSQIVELEAKIKDEDFLYNNAVSYIKYMQELVGIDNYYVELQYHRIEEEAYVMPILSKIATDLNAHVVATNDAHIPTNKEEDVMARHIQRCLRFFNKWLGEPDASDRELYIKSDRELTSILCEILPEEVVVDAMLGIKDIVDNCTGEIPQEKHYPKYTFCKNGETADDALERIVTENIKWRFPNGDWDSKYQQRLEYELRVIKDMGVSDYHLIVQDYLEYGRLLGKLPNEEIPTAPLDKEELKKYLEDKGYDVGLGIGPGRGSGVGSLVCYLLGITAIDPLKYNLLFERFLNVERVSMPDIDSDFKTDLRDRCVDYVRHVYGEKTVCRINTKGTQAAKAAIRNCARILGSKYERLNEYYDLGDSIAKVIPTEINIKLDDCMSILEENFSKNPKAMEIIKYAKTVEGCVTQFGTHAGGVIIADGNDVGDYIPVMTDDDGVWKTQCDMVEAEENGVIKMDFLGLNNLDVITDTLKLIKKRHGISIDAERLPIKKDVLQFIFSEGRTNGVFQFESSGMKSMLKQFKPDSFEDIILLVAAYRPGPMQFLENIIDIKNGRAEVTYLTPMLEPILKETYGSIIYQEQVMQIFQNLAGYSLGQADLVRRAMSKKKESVLLKERESFVNGNPERNITGCAANNIPADVANELFDQMIDFAKYAFNKSHATAYAYVSYITAYLKHYYSIEYLCALMQNIKTDNIRKKLPSLILDLKYYGIELLQPNINISESNFSIYENNIVFGLGNIKGVGVGADYIIKERELNGPYSSFKNLIERVGSNTKKNVLENLIKAGALDVFSGNRMAMRLEVAPILELITKIRETQEKLTEKMTIADKTPRILKTIDSLENTLLENKQRLNIEKLNTLVKDIDRLKEEKELTGVFLSASPLNEYKTPNELGCIPLSDIFVGSTMVMGLISNLRIVKRKKDGKPMAFFELEDISDMINVCCFVDQYEKNKRMIEEGKVVKISGKIAEVDNEFADETEFQLIAETIIEIEKNSPDLLIEIKNLEEWRKEIYPYIEERYKNNEGNKLFVYDSLFNELRVANFKVSNSILNDKKLKIVLKKN